MWKKLENKTKTYHNPPSALPRPLLLGTSTILHLDTANTTVVNPVVGRLVVPYLLLHAEADALAFVKVVGRAVVCPDPDGLCCVAVFFLLREYVVSGWVAGFGGEMDKEEGKVKIENAKFKKTRKLTNGCLRKGWKGRGR